MRLFRRQPFVLGTRQQRAQLFDGILLRARRRQIADHAQLIVAVEYRKTAAQADAGVLDLQKTQAQRMERGHGQAFAALGLYPFRHALTHLARGLVGEGDRGDVAGFVLAAGDQVCDLLGDHPGLAAASASQHQQRRMRVQYRFALRGVESVHGDSVAVLGGDCSGCRFAWALGVPAG